MTTIGVTLTGVGVTAIFGIIGWAVSQTYAKLAEIEKSLVDMKLELGKLQASLWSKEDIRELIQLEISKTLGKC